MAKYTAIKSKRRIYSLLFGLVISVPLVKLIRWNLAYSVNDTNQLRKAADVFLLGCSSCASSIGWIKIKKLPGVCAGQMRTGREQPGKSRKEYHFYDVPGRSVQDFEQYARHFADSGRKCEHFLDGSPDYLAQPDEVIANIMKFTTEEQRKKLRFFVILRDPVERLVSWFLHLNRGIVESNAQGTTDFNSGLLDNLKEYILLEFSSFESKASSARVEELQKARIIESSLYSRQLEKYFQHFAPHQFLIVSYKYHTGFTRVGSSLLYDFINCKTNCSRQESPDYRGNSSICVKPYDSSHFGPSKSQALALLSDLRKEVSDGSLVSPFRFTGSHRLFALLKAHHERLELLFHSRCKEMSRFQPEFTLFEPIWDSNLFAAEEP